MTSVTGKPKGRNPSARTILHQKGFSLLELILVMVIAAGLLALAAPSLRRFCLGRKVHEAARSFLALCKYARLKAVSEGRIYRMLVSEDAQAFRLFAQENGTFIPVQTSWGQVFRLPEGVTFTWEAQSPAAERGYLEFDPTGKCDPAHIAFRGKEGTVVHVICRAPNERFRILKEEELYLYENLDQWIQR